MPCSNMAKRECIASCNQISSQELDEPPLPRPKPLPFVKSEAMSDEQGDATSSAHLGGNQNSSQGEARRHCLAKYYEPDQNSNTSKAGPPPSSQLTTQSIQGHSPSADQANITSLKHQLSIAVVVPAPSLMQTRVTRSATKAMARLWKP